MQVVIDLIGPLPTTSNGNKYMVTLVDYFSKWPEASPLPDKSGLVLPCFSLSCFASEKFNVYTCAPSRLSICSLYSCAYSYWFLFPLCTFFPVCTSFACTSLNSWAGMTGGHSFLGIFDQGVIEMGGHHSCDNRAGCSTLTAGAWICINLGSVCCAYIYIANMQYIVVHSCYAAYATYQEKIFGYFRTLY